MIVALAIGLALVCILMFSIFLPVCNVLKKKNGEKEWGD